MPSGAAPVPSTQPTMIPSVLARSGCLIQAGERRPG